MEFGSVKAALEKRHKQGHDVPAIDNKPELFKDLQSYWFAFFNLHASRTVDMNPQPISPANLLAWLDIPGVCGTEARMRYYLHITALDLAWLKWARKKETNGETDAAKSRN